MGLVEQGQLDATVQDVPIAIHYGREFPGLHAVGQPEAPGYYVAYVRKGDERLRERLNEAIAQSDRRRHAAADLREVRRVERRPAAAGGCRQELAAGVRPRHRAGRTCRTTPDCCCWPRGRRVNFRFSRCRWRCCWA